MGRHASAHYRLEPTPALGDSRGRGGAARAEHGRARHRARRPARAAARPLGRVPGARIGFFLHIPFPASEVFRTLPNREQLLEGMLGADLVGFHTAAYVRHFGASLLRILGVAVDVDRVRVGERTVRLGVFPMGIDAARFARLAADPEVASEVSALRGSGECAVLLAIDRLDYTKGIPRRLLAFDSLLRRHPSL